MKYILNTLILLSLSITFIYSQDTEEVDFECDCPHTDESYNQNIQLNYVQFHGEETVNYISLKRDDHSAFPELHYIASVARYPVAYVSGTHSKVTAAFNSSCSHPLWIRGRAINTGNDNFEYEKKYVTPNSAGDYYYPMTESNLPFKNDVVNTFNDYKIIWEVSNNCDNWAEVGTSFNPLYVTYHAPLSDVDIHHSTIANSCRSASGTNNPNSIVNAIYELFESRCIKVVRDNGTYAWGCLTYWGDETSALACGTTSDLFLGKDGRSENFSELFKDMISVQGISGTSILEANYENGNWSGFILDLVPSLISTFFDLSTAPYTSLASIDVTELGSAILSGDIVGFLEALIESFVEDGTSLYVKQYSNLENDTYYLDSDDNDQSLALFRGGTLERMDDSFGLSAQGNFDPPSKFNSLFFVEFGGNYFDPSYGTAVKNSVVEWEDATIAGYGIGMPDLLLLPSPVPTPTMRNLHYIHKKEDGTGTQETTVN